MTNAISKLHNALETWSFKYNCYEAVHPWTPFCSECALDVGLTVFSEAIRLYTPLYLFTQLIQRRYDKASFRNTIHSILRSTTFISANAFFALLFFCSSQYFTGKFYYYAVAYVPAFTASALAVIIEKPNRRSSLAFYVANVASEALFRIYVARGYLKPVRNGQVYIFTLAIATIMLLAKKHGFDEDPLSTAIRLIIGPEEAKSRVHPASRNSSSIFDLSVTDTATSIDCNNEQTSTHSGDCIKDGDIYYETSGDICSSSYSLLSSCNKTDKIVPIINVANKGSLTDRLKNLYNWLKFLLTARHSLCPHQDSSCIYYVAKTSLRAALIGFTVQFCLKLSARVDLLISDPKLALTKIYTDPGIWSISLFLSTFSGLFKATNCILRWSLETSRPFNSFIAGLIAGPSLLMYPSPTIALYVLWKCLEALFNESIRNGLIKNKDLFLIVLYALATSQLFYSALMNPRYMKRSYMNFLDKISHHRLHMINRSVLDVFGTGASSGYEDFFPNLHPKFMSRDFMGSIWIWMIESKFMATKLEAE